MFAHPGLNALLMEEMFCRIAWHPNDSLILGKVLKADQTVCDVCIKQALITFLEPNGIVCHIHNQWLLISLIMSHPKQILSIQANSRNMI